ncbi:MAG: SprT family zinc-dependent metalloprotease, partial [Candidatus Margulisbacteria bacterium]|nr:SprT family zinc-dependent metalloprotease [Candidatus Margulisiibacteriota bacterium]
MPELRHDTGVINYSLIKSRKRRSIAIMVDPDRGVVVYAPQRLGERELLKVLAERKEWIKEKLNQVLARKAPPKSYVEGEQFLFLGRGYLLKICPARKNRVYLLNDELYVDHDGRRDVRHHLNKWYMSEAARIVKERVAIHSERLGLWPKKVAVKNQRRRWGSCSAATGSVNFNWKIIMSPLSIIDYVVVHELAHIEHPNHSRSFWSLVAR